MDIENIENVISKLEQIQSVFGTWGIILFIILILIIWLSVSYLKSSIESLPQKSLKEFQAALDQDLIKFSSTYEKQLDAIHTIYQKFQKMTGHLDYIKNGENFTQPIEPKEEVELLIKFRHEFKIVFQKNRLIFSEELGKKVDDMIGSIDNFIKIYHNGLFDLSPEDIKRNKEVNHGTYVAGIWGKDELDPILEEVKQIRLEIELEFRKIYGTET